MSQNRVQAPATFFINILGQFHLHPEPQFSLLTKELKYPEINESNKALVLGPTTYIVNLILNSVLCVLKL